MRTTNSFYYMLLILVLTMGMMYCGSDGSADEVKTADSTTLNADSAMDAHNRDPSTAYPQPPVSGTNQDSSRTRDSIKK